MECRDLLSVRRCSSPGAASLVSSDQAQWLGSGRQYAVPQHAGSRLADFDGDGWVDIFVSGPSHKQGLFRNQGNGRFEWLPGVLSDYPAEPHGCSWADLDGDGRLDLLVGARNRGTSRIYRNLGNLKFEVLWTAPNSAGDAVGVAWGDYNGDGFPDAFLTDLSRTNQLWRNTGTGRMEPVLNSPVLERQVSVGCAWADYDNDGDLDLFVTSGDNRNNSLFRNLGGVFEKITQGPPVNDAGYSVGCAWGDYDNDGDLDLFVANRLGPSYLYRNEGGRNFVRVAGGPHSSRTYGDGCTWADYDNDGDLDLFVAGPNEDLSSDIAIYRNLGNGTFQTVINEVPAGGDISSAHAVLLADYDNDGFLDLFVGRSVAAAEHTPLYRNKGNGNHWLKIRLRGETPKPFWSGCPSAH